MAMRMRTDLLELGIDKNLAEIENDERGEIDEHAIRLSETRQGRSS